MKEDIISVLYVTEPGAVVRYKTGSLIVTRDENCVMPQKGKVVRQTLLEIEPHLIETIGLLRRSHITARALRLCFELGIPVFWMKGNGKLLGRLVPELSRTADLRLKQFRLCENHTESLDLGRLFIEAKIWNATEFISSIRSNRPGNQRFGKIISKLNSLKSDSISADNREVLFGIEGEAAHLYFQALSMAFSGQINFIKRQKRPPPDPANALLSFGYVILTNKISSYLEARGFDPYLGVLHTVRSGRPSLAL